MKGTSSFASIPSRVLGDLSGYMLKKTAPLSTRPWDSVDLSDYRVEYQSAPGATCLADKRFGDSK